MSQERTATTNAVYECLELAPHEKLRGSLPMCAVCARQLRDERDAYRRLLEMAPPKASITDQRFWSWHNLVFKALNK